MRRRFTWLFVRLFQNSMFFKNLYLPSLNPNLNKNIKLWKSKLSRKSNECVQRSQPCSMTSPFCDVMLLPNSIKGKRLCMVWTVWHKNYKHDKGKSEVYRTLRNYLIMPSANYICQSCLQLQGNSKHWWYLIRKMDHLPRSLCCFLTKRSPK